MKTSVRRTIHIPENHLPVQQRCSEMMPRCSMNHYYSVPAITLRGTWTVEELAHYGPLTGKSAR